MGNPDILNLASNLKATGEAFAIATVVRTTSVTSAKAGAKAIIQSDGKIVDGWIGGGCAHAVIIKAAREAIEDGAPKLVSIQPEDLLKEGGIIPGDEKDGISFARNLCPSKGTMDIFVEPVMPKPELVICGASPVAQALATLADTLGFSRIVCAAKSDRHLFPDVEYYVDSMNLEWNNTRRRFIVVATQGRGDLDALRSALAVNSDYLAFVGSAKKIANLKGRLLDDGSPSHLFDHLKAPAGLDLNAITPEEIALSILAEIVSVRRNKQQAVVKRPPKA